MDDLHKEVATERYEMLVKHALLKNNHGGRGHNLLFGYGTSGELDETEDHFLFEVRCLTCGWWDHWDERKSDWEYENSN